jgi:nitrate/TMAO reductase-like tetraheme cytochrome c subunit
MSVLSRSLLRIALATVALLPVGLRAAEMPQDALHHVKPEACKQCHEEIYQQWQSSMHANSSAMKDPIHGAFYRNVAGDPTQEGVTLKANGKFPVCLKCHAPSAAMDKTTKLDAAEAYANGITCVNCHSFAAFKGNETPEGKPRYGIDAYHIDTEALHGPSGNTYTTARVEEGATWPTPIHHPQPLKGSNSAVFESNLACMGCHEKRGNAHGTPLCVTGKEYAGANSFVNCQSCHMGIVTVPKLKDGQRVEGEFVTIADHTMGGGHSARMVERGLAMDMRTEATDQVIKATVTVRNRLPHAFPTGAPFRNFFVKVAAYDKDGKELWKNYQVHPIKDDPQAAFWYTLGDAEGKPSAPPVATQVLADTRLKPNEARTLAYEIPRTPATAIVRAEALYDLLLPPIKANVKGKIPDDLLRPKLAASAEMRF